MKLTLIGAGPGDPELITLKAVKALQRAKVVLYDALVHPSILDHCPPDCVLHDVGKRFDRVSCKQEDINDLIVQSALQYGEVIRLKGGDSFIFGRGYEEISYAAQHGISAQIIPGISSSYAVPGLSGIPLTTRGYTESFWVITGTTKNHQLSKDLERAAKTNTTVVVLMGINHLSEIVALYHSKGRSEEPIAIIQNGTLTTQKQVQGTMATIEALVVEQEISSPAVIVIGAVAALPLQSLQVSSATDHVLPIQ